MYFIFPGNYPGLDDATTPSEHLDTNQAAKQFVVYTATEPEFVGAGAADAGALSFASTSSAKA